jgi:hypothetical protein
MGETTDQIERDIRTSRDNLADNLGELQDRFKRATDWRAQVSDRPGTMLALAFGGGILLSSILPSRRRSRSGGPGRPDVSPPSTAGTDAGVMPNVNALKGALIGVAISKASAYIEDLLPGFKEEFSKAKASG